MDKDTKRRLQGLERGFQTAKIEGQPMSEELQKELRRRVKEGAKPEEIIADYRERLKG